ncbi:MAG: CRTAC1 family protein [Acidobacteriota bacterium]
MEIRPVLRLLFWLSFLPLVAASCDYPARSTAEAGAVDRPVEPLKSADATKPHRPLFVDMTADSGVHFMHYNAASKEKWLPETMGSGVAVFDFDNDGLPDLFFLNGSTLDGKGEHPTGRLYRNVGENRFVDATEGSGLDESFFGMGAAVGDIDNDGWDDLAVSTTNGTRIYRNLGGGHFQNVTRQMGLDCPGFGASLAFLDYDRDGFLDLFVGRYVQWTPQTDIPCSPDRVHRTYCTPELYPGITNCLFRNVKGKRFENKSKASGVGRLVGKTLGVAIIDLDADGWPDIAVANDTIANYLLVNHHDGTFGEEGIETGLAYSESGAARGGMGIDAGDLDGDGTIDVVIGNFSQEMAAFFRSVEPGYFIDDAAPAGIGLPTLMTLAFGTLVEDFDNDGWLDVLLANGHIEPEISETRRSQSYRQPPQFFRNLGKGHFELLDSSAIDPPNLLLVGRGFASGDFDRDGDLDFVITQNGDRAVLIRNDSTDDNDWLQIRLEGERSNRMGLGARIQVVAGGKTLTRYLESGRSYLSSCEPVVTVGLGQIRKVDRVIIDWPSGTHQVIESPPTRQRLTIHESE